MKKIVKVFVFSFILLTALNLRAQEPQTSAAKNARQWTKSRQWSNGWTVNPHRSTDYAEFARQYHLNRELWDKAFRFLQENDLNSLSAGTTVIEEGRCWATVSEYIPKDTRTGNIESHCKFIDLQYTFSGEEKMGLADLANVTVRVPYSEARDIAFYSAGKIRYYRTTPEVFFLFFPNDIHQPSVLDGATAPSRKIVLKIEYKAE